MRYGTKLILTGIALSAKGTAVIGQLMDEAATSLPSDQQAAENLPDQFGSAHSQGLRPVVTVDSSGQTPLLMI